LSDCWDESILRLFAKKKKGWEENERGMEWNWYKTIISAAEQVIEMKSSRSVFVFYLYGGIQKEGCLSRDFEVYRFCLQ
jgi:hypothetical protein